MLKTKRENVKVALTLYEEAAMAKHGDTRMNKVCVGVYVCA